MRRVVRVMGTVVSIDVRDEIAPEALDEVARWLHWVEATFTVHRSDSQVSRVGRGELARDDADPMVRRVLVHCEDLRSRTGGAFQHEPGRSDRPLDPSAFVKGWSIDEAVIVLRAAGARSFCVNAGGDVRCGDAPPGQEAWRIGVRHPDHAHDVAAVLGVENAAVATSGRYERGDHIWGAPASGLRSVTVVGPELATADALATAVFAGGDPAASWFAGFGVYELLVMDDRLRWTPGLDAVLVAPIPGG